VREHFVVLRHRGEFALRHHVHHLVAAGLELAEQFWQRLGGMVLEVVHQDDALAVFFQLAHHRFDHFFRLVQLEVAGVDIGREHAVGNSLFWLTAMTFEAEVAENATALRGSSYVSSGGKIS
jgi:hypothetical protein